MLRRRARGRRRDDGAPGRCGRGHGSDGGTAPDATDCAGVPEGRETSVVRLALTVIAWCGAIVAVFFVVMLGLLIAAVVMDATSG